MGWAPADHDFGIDLGGWLAIIAAAAGFTKRRIFPKSESFPVSEKP